MGQALHNLVFRPPVPATYINNAGLNWIATKGASVIPAFYLKRDSPLVVLYSHGNAEDLGLLFPYVERCADVWGVSFFCYEYTGYGLSSGGAASESHLYDDVEAAYHYLVDSLRYAPSQIIAFGKSLGSVPATHIASRKPALAALVLQSALASVMRVKLPHIPHKYPGDFGCNIDKIGDVKCPVLLVHGSEDTLCSLSHAKALAAKHSGPTVTCFIDGGGHNDLDWPPFSSRVDTAMRMFIKQILTLCCSQDKNLSYSAYLAAVAEARLFLESVRVTDAGHQASYMNRDCQKLMLDARARRQSATAEANERAKLRLRCQQQHHQHRRFTALRHLTDWVEYEQLQHQHLFLHSHRVRYKKLVLRRRPEKSSASDLSFSTNKSDMLPSFPPDSSCLSEGSPLPSAAAGDPCSARMVPIPECNQQYLSFAAASSQLSPYFSTTLADINPNPTDPAAAAASVTVTGAVVTASETATDAAAATPASGSSAASVKNTVDSAASITAALSANNISNRTSLLNQQKQQEAHYQAEALATPAQSDSWRKPLTEENNQAVNKDTLRIAQGRRAAYSTGKGNYVFVENYYQKNGECRHVMRRADYTLWESPCCASQIPPSSARGYSFAAAAAHHLLQRQAL